MKKIYESERLILRKPTLEDKEALLEYKQEFINNNEKSFGDGGLAKMESYKEWLNKIALESNEKTVTEGRVPATQFISIRKEDGKIIGTVNVRHRLVEALMLHGGHIGDSVRKSERNKGYATEQIGLALEFCRDLGLEKVLMACKKTNSASAKSIINNKGIKENEVNVDGTIYERFWVSTNLRKNNEKGEKVMDFILKLPTKKYKEKIKEYKECLVTNNSSMDGCGDLRKDDIDTWLKKCNDWRFGKNLPEGYVPATQYILVRKSDDKIVGMLQIRHELNDFLFNIGGHIGDSIAFDERGKGYGKLILKLGLEKCKKLGINKVLISCLDTNTPSRKCILANGGKFESTAKDGDKTVERYWIKL